MKLQTPSCFKVNYEHYESSVNFKLQSLEVLTCILSYVVYGRLCQCYIGFCNFFPSPFLYDMRLCI